MSWDLSPHYVAIDEHRPLSSPFPPKKGRAAAAEATAATAAEAAEAAATAGVRFVCLAGSDARYAEMAVDTARALKQAGVATVYLAGKPGTSEADYHEAGIDGFVFAGMDLVEALAVVHGRLGIGG